MAVVQISRIQIRRGQKNQGTGLPQLSSGELGWAIDTQEMFVGNGSVAEGAPQVGNTKVITEHDDLFQLADSYIYRNGDGAIVTGIDSVNPVKRSLQDRLDDRVSSKSFGLTGEQSQDATVLLQRAIDQLFLNAGTQLSTSNRVELHLEPGIYTINDTIKVPPFATIHGAGKDKTIIRQLNTGRACIQTVSEESIPGGYIVGGEYATQARDILIDGLTLTVTGGSKGMILDSCRDSNFSNIKINGNWLIGDIVPTDTTTTSDIALSLNSKNGGVESSNNTFYRCDFENFGYGVVSNWDINDNIINQCNFTTLGYGIAFGKDMVVDAIPGNGTSVGPSNNIIKSSVFKDTLYQAILITNGGNNVSKENKFYTCANNGGGDDQPETAIVTIDTLSNKSVNDYFSRTKVLSYSQGFVRESSATLVAGGLSVIVASTADINPGQLLIKKTGIGEFGFTLTDNLNTPEVDTDITTNARVDQVISPTEFTVTIPHLASGAIAFELVSPIIEDVAYVPEVEGPVNYDWGYEHEVTILDGDANTIFRLPKLQNQAFVIEYTSMSEQGYNGMRSGTMQIVVNATTDVANGTPSLLVSDEYDYLGDDLYLDTISFDAILDNVGNTPDLNTIIVKSNASGLPTEARSKFKFKVKTKQTV